MPARVADDRLKQLALVERADDGGDRIHQLEMQSFHFAGKLLLRIGSELEEAAIKCNGELSTHRPYRVERLPDEINLFRRRDADRGKVPECVLRKNFTNSRVGADPHQDRRLQARHSIRFSIEYTVGKALL